MAFWRAIDWQRPWLAPYRALGEAVIDPLQGGLSVAEALNRIAGDARPALGAGALRFVAQDELPEGEAYEAFIARTACVPTRDKLHDLFNGLVWLRFPAIKRRLNELQAEQIARAGVGAVRGPVRDALTLFDENAALWSAPPALASALAARDWHALFIAGRAEWRDAPAPLLFGHALMEKLVHPRPAMTAHVVLLPAAQDLVAATLCWLTSERLAAKPFCPLPVLGIPGWWPANEWPAFYADTQVFRPPNPSAMRQSAP